MKQPPGLVLALLMGSILPAPGQKIENQTSDRSRIVHLKTAINHLTVIEVGEPVVEVAAGSPSFKVEWRENKVFVQPTEVGATTNLFIWTADQRLNYELEPAGSVKEMDFAVDQAPARSAHFALPVKARPESGISDLLLEGRPVRMQPSKRGSDKPVEVWISDLYEQDGRLLVRYAVRNWGTRPYALKTPQVYQLDGVRAPQSLYGLVNRQLSDEQAAKLKVRQEVPLKVVGGESRFPQVAPGAEAIGVVALQVPPTAWPIVLKFQFPAPNDPATNSGRRNRRVSAFLVR